jgi:hypothetical protein
MDLTVILGGGGVILLLVGLLGGGFQISGHMMPVIRSKVMRVICLLAGGLLILWAVGISVLQQEAKKPETPPPNPSPTIIVSPPSPQNPQPQTFPANVRVEQGYVAPLYFDPWTASDPNAGPDATLERGAPLDLVCTTRGPLSTASNGYQSDIWYLMPSGHYIPDALTDTGSTTAPVPSC